MSASNPLQLTRRNLLKLGGMVMVSSVAAAGLVAESTGTAPAVAGAFPIPPIDRVSSFIAIGADGSVTAYHGHVDLGTGIRTSLAQLVADELDVEFERITMVLGHTGRTPNQGPTIASNTIQVDAIPMRKAAAQVRQLLLGLAAEKLQQPVSALTTSKGAVVAKGGRRIGYGELAQGQDLNIALDKEVPLRTGGFNYIGKSVQRVDIPAKVLGALAYVHDVRVPGMLHGRVVRPPYGGADASAPLGSSLISVNEQSVAHLPGIVKVVVQGDFVGIVAEREEQAIAAMRQLEVKWKDWAGVPDLSLNAMHDTLVKHEKTDRMLREDAGIDEAFSGAKKVIEADYVWPYHLHASIGPSCAVAEVSASQIQVWTGSQNPHDVRKDIATLTGMAADQINVTRLEASGCYGRNCADDVASDAVLLSQAVGRPVRVQLMREQEAAWEPKGTGQLIRVRGGLDENHAVLGYELKTCYPSNDAAALALILTGKVPNKPKVLQMGDRTAIPQYEYPKMRVVSQDAAPIVRASWMRGVSALPNVFAHECWIDECAYLAGEDPLAYRLRYLKDPRAVALTHAAHKQAGWQDGPAHRNPAPADQRLVKGRGFAYARYYHSKFPGYGAAWATWICDVTVDRETGVIKVDKVFVAHDCGEMVNPAGVRHQVHGNIIQSTSRVLKEYVTFDSKGVTSLDWGGYPILRFDELPEIDVQLVERPGEDPMGAGESASVPSAAAVSNAVFDATGVRLREVPFTPARVLAALKAQAADAAPADKAQN
ncbi:MULTISPECIES: xanthine dehydrogenase family protein molybdopterin-binding subunit [Delftia]|jgi:CO/xanthine dehydrogenase Mo-binding subunit|uniref:Molybdopterin cofactor-binding domain-containing protein n=1 Tax=Delftia acidovorans TaxID=80866 RepID=A0AAJ2R2B2_DELAC|nr:MULTISPECIES: molybdopterin cofactor-binding domain-containing protein [Delftia]PIF37448.1 CO/xanthine dehydrogenase Mo-binding subunit [Burkholderiales bacterium 23]MBJ2139660.1 xanthine dehydrogenase family protein molybdopterin-binding subunit [Delftia acidovorans]MCG3786109.1 molybdopterin-dependent oxidoreductase [Delftia acidovorans]MDX4954553.1 molybdopterin cofactor-binding domain-containing protein [Delftia acidovorans]PIF67370.1 CO/xanthine dehydrogenase Mo-binding subunit [Delfti